MTKTDKGCLTFFEMIEAVVTGKKVRRPCFVEGCYWELEGEVLVWDDNSDVIIDIERIKATDWEIIE